MGKKLFRMRLSGSLPLRRPPADVKIVAYDRDRHHEPIRYVYAGAFGEDPWPADWDDIEEFDPNGVFVAVHEPTSDVVGFVVSFRREEDGYISVVAVLPAYQRRGIASTMVAAAVDYLRSLGLEEFLIDAFVTSKPAVATYRSLGFRVVKIFEDSTS